MTTTPPCEGYFHQGEALATETDMWTGDRWCPECAKGGYRIQTTPLTMHDVTGVLRDAVTQDEPDHHTDYQTNAMEQLAALLVYQQKRITELEAAVTKLTGHDD